MRNIINSLRGLICTQLLWWVVKVAPEGEKVPTAVGVQITIRLITAFNSARAYQWETDKYEQDGGCGDNLQRDPIEVETSDDDWHDIPNPRDSRRA